VKYRFAVCFEKIKMTNMWTLSDQDPVDYNTTM